MRLTKLDNTWTPLITYKKEVELYLLQFFIGYWGEGRGKWSKLVCSEDSGQPYGDSMGWTLCPVQYIDWWEDESGLDTYSTEYTPSIHCKAKQYMTFLFRNNTILP